MEIFLANVLEVLRLQRDKNIMPLFRVKSPWSVCGGLYMVAQQIKYTSINR